MDNIILVGFMGVGKSTIGSELAKKISYKFLDSDNKIEERAGMSIPDIFRIYGEKYFRRLEFEIIKDIVNMSGIVLATGGGAVMNKQLFEMLMSKGTVIHLDASLSTLYDRLKDSNNRPMLNHSNRKKRIDELYSLRRPVYMKAHHTINTDGKKIEDIVDEIVEIIIGREEDKR